MTPHYVQKRRTDGSVNRIPYYRCTKTMQFNNKACSIKHVNALEVEGTIVRELTALSRNDAYVRMTVEEANRERGRRAEPLQQEETRLGKRLAEIEAEIQRFVAALGKGRLSAERLESAIQERETVRRGLQSELDEVRQRLAAEMSASVNADLLLKALGDFDAVFASLTPQEQKDAVQCVLQGVTVTADKLLINVFELAEFTPAGSQDRPNWLLVVDAIRTVGASPAWQERWDAGSLRLG